jgi:hypothetical protein
VIHFGLKNSPTIFSRVVVAALKYFIHKCLEVYLNDWTIFGLLKDHVEVLRLILDRCRQFQISLNINKYIFSAPFGILLGHVVCKHGMLVEPTKVVVIVNLPPPKAVRQLRDTLDHTCYYIKFIKNYTQIISPMETLLKKDIKFQWNDECQQSLDILKRENGDNTNSGVPRLVKTVPCSCGCLFNNTWSSTSMLVMCYIVFMTNSSVSFFPWETCHYYP